MYDSYNDYTYLDRVFEPSKRLALVKDEIKPRLYNRGWREVTLCSPVGTNGKNPMVDVFYEMPDEPFAVVYAHAIVRSWMETPCVIFPNEAIVGITRPRYPLMEHFREGLIIREGSFKEGNYPQSEIDRTEALLPRIHPSFEHKVPLARLDEIGCARYDRVGEEGVFGASPYGHTIPNYETLLQNGLDGMLNKIDYWANINDKTDKTAEFYESARVIVRGMSDYLMMYSNKANELYLTEKDPTQKQYYKEISENCAYVAHNKPKTLYQAIQLMWCLSLWDWVDCLGRVDQYLYPFYEYSIKNGDVISVEDSITSLMYKIWENGAHNTTVSGCLPQNGEDATNDLSYLFLQVLRSIHDTHPRMVVRVGENMPERLMDLVTTIWSDGMSDPTLVSDTLVIPALQRIEVPLEDARDYATLGCQEIEIPGKSNTGCEDGSLNLGKVFQIAMRGGMSEDRDDVRVGPETKTFIECETFEEFFDSFKTQLEFFTELFCCQCSRSQEMRAAWYSKLVKGVFTTGCLERGLNHDDGGPIYGYGVAETGGLAAVADSMTAIKKLVFDEKFISKQELLDALKANYKGYEKIRLMLLNSAPKFGNDNDEADQMAQRVLDLFWSELNKYRSVRGGLYTGACSLLSGGISQAQHCGAMPNGRFQGDPFGNTMGPQPGADTNGLTAMLSSVSKLPLNKGVGGSTLNVILTQKMLETPEQRKNIGAIMRNYMATGGQMAQITTASLDDLLDARVHPERHGDLIVRVGGYSAQFVLEDAEVQDEIIKRYMN